MERDRPMRSEKSRINISHKVVLPAPLGADTTISREVFAFGFVSALGHKLAFLPLGAFPISLLARTV